MDLIVSDSDPWIDPRFAWHRKYDLAPNMQNGRRGTEIKKIAVSLILYEIFGTRISYPALTLLGAIPVQIR